MLAATCLLRVPVSQPGFAGFPHSQSKGPVLNMAILPCLPTSKDAREFEYIFHYYILQHAFISFSIVLSFSKYFQIGDFL